MPCWYYEKKELKNTPSLHDAIDFETESRYRKEGARFIIDTGTKMDLGYNTMATGVVYFHRFYMFHSFRDFPRYVTACCCLFLAGKVEETPKKCKDIIKTARGLLTDQKFLTFGDDPKEEVMTLERILLQTIKFDLQVEHPYSYLLKYAKCLKGDKVKLQKMVQMAWTFVNDSLCTTLSLQWEPEVIAVALMYLAGKLSKFEVVDWIGRASKHLRWWDMFVEDVTMDLLEDICHQVLDLYSQPAVGTTCDSPPLLPITRSPGMKKERMPRPISPMMLHSSPPPPGQAIPVKVSKAMPILPMEDSSMDNIDAAVSKVGEVIPTHYQYGSYTHTGAPTAFPATYTTPIVVPTVVPVNPAAVPPYQHYTHQYPGSQYYQQPQPTQRPYYPPTGP